MHKSSHVRSAHQQIINVISIVSPWSHDKKISLKLYLAPYKLIKTFSSLKIIWIPIVSSNYGPHRAFKLVYHRFFKFKFQCMYFNMQKFESSLWLLNNFWFFNTCTNFFFFFSMAFPLDGLSFIKFSKLFKKDAMMLSGQNMKSLQKLILSRTHFHKI